MDTQLNNQLETKYRDIMDRYDKIKVSVGIAVSAKEKLSAKLNDIYDEMVKAAPELQFKVDESKSKLENIKAFKETLTVYLDKLFTEMTDKLDALDENLLKFNQLNAEIK